MAICIDGNCITFDNATFCNTAEGIDFGETINAPVVCIAPSVQGSSFGYASGGEIPNPSGEDQIQKFPFSSDTSSTDVGELTCARRSGGAASSSVSGYAAGGYSTTNIIDKFPFSSDASATSVGTLTICRGATSGQNSDVNGYTSGGGPGTCNTIDKYPFSSDTNASDVGDLTQTKRDLMGHSSSSAGFVTGGGAPNLSLTLIDSIECFTFAADVNSRLTGRLNQPKARAASHSSDVCGYISGGETPPGVETEIEKFSFSTGVYNNTVGDLTCARQFASGTNSTVSGYASGGEPPSTNVIDKFPFASDTNATDVGELLTNRFSAMGQQV